MGILDYFLKPALLEINDPKNQEKIKSAEISRLTRNQQRQVQRLCQHTNTHYEKWVHKGRKEGVKDSFHYKSKCEDCGKSTLLSRTKELYELLKNEKWHYKNKLLK